MEYDKDESVDLEAIVLRVCEIMHAWVTLELEVRNHDLDHFKFARRAYDAFAAQSQTAAGPPGRPSGQESERFRREGAAPSVSTVNEAGAALRRMFEATFSEAQSFADGLLTERMGSELQRAAGLSQIRADIAEIIRSLRAIRREHGSAGEPLNDEGLAGDTVQNDC